MGGTLYLILPNSADNDREENFWCYSYTGFQNLKGMAMRAAIAYLEAVQRRIDERKSDPTADPRESVRFLFHAGFFVFPGHPTDPHGFDEATRAIAGAVPVVRTWLCEQTLDERGQAELLPGMFEAMLAGRSANALMAEAGSAELDDMINMNYRFSVVSRLEACPLELIRVGMPGLGLHAKLPDNGQEIRPDMARMIHETFARVFEYLPEEWKEMGQGFRDLLRRCDQNERSMIRD